MTATLLNSNRRALAFLLGLASLVLLIASSVLVFGLPRTGPLSVWNRTLAIVLCAVIGGTMLIGISVLVQLKRPRLAYRDGMLLVNVGMFRQFAVPVQCVECFFLGRTATHLPGNEHLNPRVATVVVRLSESASDYANRDLPRRSGKWEDGYITIYGTWCEPLSVERVNQLNAQFRQWTHGQLQTEK